MFVLEVTYRLGSDQRISHRYNVSQIFLSVLSLDDSPLLNNIAVFTWMRLLCRKPETQSEGSSCGCPTEILRVGEMGSPDLSLGSKSLSN